MLLELQCISHSFIGYFNRYGAKHVWTGVHWGLEERPTAGSTGTIGHSKFDAIIISDAKIL